MTTIDPKTGEPVVTHQDLLGKHTCPALVLKHLLTHGMAERIHDNRRWPGDGHYWCARTCTCIGPDDEVVHPKYCQPGRRCYDGPAPQA